MALSHKFHFGFLIVAVLVGAPSLARAATYTYTGNPFDTFVTEGGIPPSTAATVFGGKFVSGEFTVPNALGADFNGVVNPSEFSFSGALIPLTDPNRIYSFDIQTSDVGAIIAWAISISVGNSIATNRIFTSNAGDSSFSLGPTTFIEGSNSAPGTWSGPSLATPLPAALPSFAAGLALLGLVVVGLKRRIRSRNLGN